MTHNNLLCILSFHSWNLIFQLLNFFLLGKRLDFEIRNQNFHTPAGCRDSAHRCDQQAGIV
nr:MAG TPA: hypothetical protein [Caudoviricetes sp.]